MRKVTLEAAIQFQIPIHLTETQAEYEIGQVLERVKGNLLEKWIQAVDVEIDKMENEDEHTKITRTRETLDGTGNDVAT
jgi:uncharacterized protein (DUF2235 family)